MSLDCVTCNEPRCITGGCSCLCTRNNCKTHHPVTCQKCKSTRIFEVNSKASDCHWTYFNGKEDVGYLNSNIGIGGGDYLEMTYCLECGQIQGKWPLPDPDNFGTGE